MKRDMDLVLKILRSVEAREDAGVAAPVAVEGYTAEQIGFHAKLLADAGRLEVVAWGVGGVDRGYSCYYPRGLTNEGYDFLEVANKTAKDDKHWNKFKAVTAEHGLSVSVDVLKKLLLSML